MNWPRFKLGELIALEYGKPLRTTDRDSDGEFLVAGSNGPDGLHSEAFVAGPGIVVGRKGSAGKVVWYERDFWPIDTTYYAVTKVILDLKWAYYLLLNLNLDRLATTTGVPGLNRNDAYSLEVPYPPISEQRRIVEILDQADRLRRLRAEADAKADHILQTVFAKTLGAPTTWSANSRARSLAELVDLVSGGTPSKREERYWTGEIPWVSPKDMKQEFLHDTEDHISSDAVEDSNLKRVDRGAVIIVVRGMILARKVPVSLVRRGVTINQDLKAILPRSPQVSGEYLWAVLSLARDLLLGEIRTAGHGTRKLDTRDLLQLRIPVPSDTQLALVTSVVLTHEGLVKGRARSRKVIDHLFDVLLGRAFTGQLTASWRESHMTELLDEMQEQTKSLAGVS